MDLMEANGGRRQRTSPRDPIFFTNFTGDGDDDGDDYDDATGTDRDSIDLETHPVGDDKELVAKLFDGSEATRLFANGSKKGATK